MAQKGDLLLQMKGVQKRFGGAIALRGTDLSIRAGEIHALLGEAGADYKSWVDWVEKTGGDDPKKAGQLILKLVSDESAAINGRFCWIDNPLQEPIPSWDDPTDERPWI